MKQAFHIAAVVALLVLLVHSNTIRVNQWKPNGHTDLSALPKHHMKFATSGTTAKLVGGYLTYGTYYINTTIDGEDYSLIVDTGSANTMIESPSSTATPWPCNDPRCHQCQPDGSTCKGCAFGPKFCNSKNACAVGVTYGGGSSALGGYYTTQKVCLTPSLCAPKATVGIIDHPVSFPTPKKGGIMGFAHPFNACNPTCVDPIMQSLAKSEGTPLQFGMCIVQHGGLMDIGILNFSRAASDVVYTNITMKRWYNMDVHQVAVGNHVLEIPRFLYDTTNDQIGTFVDSGTTLILAAPAIYQEISRIFTSNYAHIKGVDALFGKNAQACIPDGSYDPVSQWPPLKFSFPHSHAAGTFDIQVPASNYLMKSQGGVCLGIAEVVGVGLVLGDVFLVDQYVVYDQANGVVGFAPLKQAGCQ